MSDGKQLLTLTAQGREELKTRAYKLDAMGRNILFLIDKGISTPDALVERSVFPRSALLSRIAQLVTDRFVDAGAAQGPGGGAANTAMAGPLDALQLQPGISLSQARFALCDFCLDHFGTRSQALVDAINRCADAPTLQQALNRIAGEIRLHHAGALPVLVSCVAEINESAA